jgi:ELWxxDGT repeat protein
LVRANASFPDYWTNVSGTLFFIAQDAASFMELWRTNGTSAGTMLIKDINPGVFNHFPTFLTNVNGTLLFQANNGVSGQELWKSNGTPAGTVLVKDIFPGSTGSVPTSLANVNGAALFGANNGVSGRELWRSNGTANGTVLVKDINPGKNGSYPANLSSHYAPFPTLNGTMFFRASDGLHQFELWESNGTAAGTSQVAAVYPGGTGSTAVNGTLFFSADDGVHGLEPWVLGPVPVSAISALPDASTIAAAGISAAMPTAKNRDFAPREVTAEGDTADLVFRSLKTATIATERSGSSRDGRLDLGAAPSDMPTALRDEDTIPLDDGVPGNLTLDLIGGLVPPRASR